MHSVAVDAAAGVTTGISAADRARTITALADARTAPEDLARPGHVVPLRVDAHGVLAHRGPAEAAADLAALAGFSRTGAFGELIGLDDPTRLAQAAEARLFAKEHELAVLSINDVVEHRMRRDRVVERCAEARLPLAAGTFRAVGYRNLVDGREHLALVHDRPAGTSRSTSTGSAQQHFRLDALRMPSRSRHRPGRLRSARSRDRGAHQG